VECPTSPEVAADPAWWRGFSEERAAIREIDGGRRREEAAGLAFADVILKWHQRYGVRPDSRRCAGCGDELTGETGLVLCDGARVHLDGARGVKCAIAYGLKWRGAAVAALRVLGLDPPRGCCEQTQPRSRGERPFVARSGCRPAGLRARQAATTEDLSSMGIRA
jgi:hypothetical protein